MITPFNISLLELEKRCLVRLSIAARESNKLQVALNSIVKARRLEGVSTHEVSQEFAHVLWLQNEQKLAVQFLKDLLSRQNQTSSCGPELAIERALSMAHLVGVLSRPCQRSIKSFDALGILDFGSVSGKADGHQAEIL